MNQENLGVMAFGVIWCLPVQAKDERNGILSLKVNKILGQAVFEA